MDSDRPGTSIAGAPQPGAPSHWQPVLESLQSLLCQSFQIVPARTKRHDQWYKRRYQSWLDQDDRGGKELFILTPKISRDDWAPALLQLATNLAQRIEEAAASHEAQLHASGKPHEGKLFPDLVLDKPALMGAEKLHQLPALHPSMQKISFWESASELERASAVHALLQRGEIASLVYLARHKQHYIQGSASLRSKSASNREQGWSKLVDEILQVFFFLGILDSYREELLADQAYENWLPFGGLLSNKPPASRFVDALEKQKMPHQPMADTLLLSVAACFRTLAHIHTLYQAANLGAISWDTHISNAMLYYIGFEAWNRERQGQGYLGCGLNTAKDERWLRHGLPPDDEVRMSPDLEATSKKQLDPLHLRPPRQDPLPESQDTDPYGLENLEMEEAAYGTKRSTKYQRKPSAP